MLWRYGLAMLVLMTIVARFAMGLNSGDTVNDYAEASVTGLVAASLAVAIAYRIRSGSRFIVGTIAGLLLIAVLAAGVHRA